MTHHPKRIWPIILAATLVLAAFCTIVIASARPGQDPSAPATAPTASGISAAAAELLQLDPLGKSGGTAPSYTLTDQNGKTITPAGFRGRSVVLTFNDDECADLCTLLAQDVVLADRDLGALAKNVAFVSINANPYFPAVPDVAAWSTAHGLGHASNWYFGTARPAVLAATAKAFGVPIELDPSDKSVVHGTEIFFIGPSGTERALGQFGTSSANTAPFAHTMAQEAVNLLPAAQRGKVGGSATVDLATGGSGVGAKPRPFQLPELTGTGQRGIPSSSGHYTVLNFWASTCSACVGELPSLQKVSAAYAGRADFLGIDVSDDPSAARALATRSSVGFPLVADANGAVASRFRISGLPYTVILDGNGRVVVRHPGAFTDEQLSYILDTLLPASGS